MKSNEEGKCAGAHVRLWQNELPDKFEHIKIGDKIRVPRGPFAGQTFKVVGKLVNKYDRFVFCDNVDLPRTQRPRV